MPENLDFRFLYYFSCDAMDVLEVKVNGLAEGTSIGRVYHWLYVDRTTQQVHKFGFKSMGKDGNKGLRSFEQGELWFDAPQAGLTLHDGRVCELVVNAVDSVPESLVSRVQAFLQQELDD